MRFASQSGRFVGVDYDTHRLRIVHVEAAGKRTRVRKLQSFDMPGDIDLADSAAIGTHLADCLKKMRLKGSPIVMHVPRSSAVLKPMTLPSGGSESELAGMVQYQMQRDSPFDAADTVIDFAVEHHYDAHQPAIGSGSTTVLVAAVRAQVIEQRRQVAEAAGVKLQRVGLRPYANMCCVEAGTTIKEDEGLAVIHITAEETEIDVVLDGSVAFSRAATVRVPQHAGANDQAVGEVVAEVARSLKSYQAVQRGHRIDRLLVAGDTGIEHAAAAQLRQQLGVPCDMLELTEIELPEDDSVSHPSAYISALGLAISHGAEANLPFDFLNPKQPGRDVDPMRRKLTIIGGCVAVAALLLAAFGGYHVISLQSEADKLLDKYNALNDENRKGKAIVQRVEKVDRWGSQSRNWINHWAHLSSLLPGAKDLYVTSFSATAERGIVMQLRARDDQIITDLGTRLAEAGYDFKPGSVSTANDKFGYNYATTLRVLVDPKMKIDLAELKPVERPADDGAARLIQTHGKAHRKKGATP